MIALFVPLAALVAMSSLVVSAAAREADDASRRAADASWLAVHAVAGLARAVDRVLRGSARPG